MDESKKPKRGQQWANSYEAQLSDEELRFLHEALLAREPSDTELRLQLPAWRSGKRKGQLVALSTLSNIRDRLEMEEAAAEDTETVRSLQAQLKEEQPDISEEELERIGVKQFTLLAMRRQNLAGFVAIRSARNKAKQEALKLEMREKELAQRDKTIALDEKRYRRETAELFLKFYEDKRAKEAASAPGTHAERLKRIETLMFGEEDAKEATP